MNGLVYLAGGNGPHPVVVFLHGYPGNEKNLDLAQAVRRAGYHAVYFDYRGSWGTAGTFSFKNGLEDVSAALTWLRTPENATRYSVDIGRIALIGHSFGGWLALMQAGREPPAVCIAALAAWNVGWAAKRFANNSEEREANRSYFRATTESPSGPIKADADQLMQEMVRNSEAWDYLGQSFALGHHALFLAGATRDTADEDAAMHARLAEAMAAAGMQSPSHLTFDDDHSFSANRDALAKALVRWLNSDCAARQRSEAVR